MFQWSKDLSNKLRYHSFKIKTCISITYIFCSIVLSIGAMHMEAITLRAMESFSVEKRQWDVCLCVCVCMCVIMPRTYISPKPDSPSWWRGKSGFLLRLTKKRVKPAPQNISYVLQSVEDVWKRKTYLNHYYQGNCVSQRNEIHFYVALSLHISFPSL